MLEPAGGEEAHRALQVMVTAHAHDEAHLFPDVVFQRGEERWADCVTESNNARAPVAGKVGPTKQIGERIRNFAGIRGTDRQLSKTGQVGRQHRKAGARQGRSEGHESRVVFALWHGTRYDHDGGARAVRDTHGCRMRIDRSLRAFAALELAGQIKIGVARPPGHLV